MRHNKAIASAAVVLLMSLVFVGCDTPAHAQPYRDQRQRNEDVIDDLLYNRRTQGMCIFDSVEEFNSFTKKYNNIIHVSSVSIANSSQTRQAICAVIQIDK